MIQLPIEHLIERIGRVHKNLVLELDDVSAWCFEAMEDSATYEDMEEQMGVALTVTDGKAMLPINIYRLLSVRSECGPCGELCYTRGSRCLSFPGRTNGVAYVDMLVFPVDERGYALVPDNLMAVCHYYVLTMVLMEPYFQGVIPANIYESIGEKYNRAVANNRASFQNITSDKIRRITRLLRSSVVAKQFKPR